MSSELTDDGYDGGIECDSIDICDNYPSQCYDCVHNTYGMVMHNDDIKPYIIMNVYWN